MTELRRLRDNEHEYIKDDPVRPHFSYEWRTFSGREVWTLTNEQDRPDAIICVAFTNEVPTNEWELDLYSQAAQQEGQHGSIAVFYTVWSYRSGAGQEIVNGIAKHLYEHYPWLNKWVTLSPLTEMAERFHIRNGAILLARHVDCQNFDYTHTLIKD